MSFKDYNNKEICKSKATTRVYEQPDMTSYTATLVFTMEVYGRKVKLYTEHIDVTTKDIIVFAREAKKNFIDEYPEFHKCEAKLSYSASI